MTKHLGQHIYFTNDFEVPRLQSLKKAFKLYVLETNTHFHIMLKWQQFLHGHQCKLHTNRECTNAGADVCPAWLSKEVEETDWSATHVCMRASLYLQLSISTQGHPHNREILSVAHPVL